MSTRAILSAQPYDAGAVDKLLDELDPITLEVIRMGLHEISMDMATTMARVSGSPIFTEVNDFSTGLLDVQGEHLAFGGYLQLHMSNSLLCLEHLLANEDLEKMQPGDAWVCNDAFIGSSQANDMGVLTPIFAEGKVVAFSWSEGHVLDIGGSVAGGFAVGAKDCFAEGIRFPNVKIAGPEGIERDTMDMIKNNVRLPVSVENDMRALLASNRVGRLRTEALIERYGLADFERYCEGFKAASERLFRRRLEGIADNRWEIRDWAEHDGHVNEIYELNGTLEVKGDELSLYFDGDPQTNGIVNGTAGSVLGNTLTALMQVLAPDIPYNSGILRAIDLSVEDGSVLSALPPAPVSASHMEATTRASKMTTLLLSQAALTSEEPEIRQLAMGQFHDAFPVMIWFGENEQGPVAFANTDGGMGGGAAQSVVDGLDIAATMTQPGNALVDVEGQELLYPILYLYRRLAVDSAGPGAYRGGLGGEGALIPWGIDGFVGTLTTACNQVPPRGAAGGHIAGAAWFELVEDVDFRTEFFENGKQVTFEDIETRGRLLEAKNANVTFAGDHIFKYGMGGGGGFGDPLLRDPAQVAIDVADGYVTASAAERAYGVALGEDGGVDEARTEELRRSIRTDRLGHEPTRDVERTHSYGEAFDRIIEVSDSGGVGCNACGGEFEGADGNWRAGAVERRRNLQEAVTESGARVAEREGLEAVEYLCPDCGTSLEVTVAVAAGTPA